ncbi:MAG: asparagine synthetase B family protein, partial [Gemmatimonadota bacterium]
LVWHEDEPLAHPSSVALYFVAELASRHVKVVLTGEGSDELLAGYGRYWKTLYNQALGRPYQQLTSASLRRGVRGLIEGMPGPKAVRNKLRRTFLCLSPELESIYLDNFAVFSRRRQHALLASDTRERLGRIDPYAFMRSLLDDADDLDPLNTLLFLDMHTYLHELLMKQDQMSMAASVESRVPFLDHELVEFAARLPRRMKLRGRTTKYILRRAFTDMLPEPILSRSKAGFPVPIGTWFRERYRAVVHDYVLGERSLRRGIFDAAAIERLAREHQSGAVDHSERLWALVNLELWHRLFIDREPREAVGRTLLAVAAT